MVSIGLDYNTGSCQPTLGTSKQMESPLDENPKNKTHPWKHSQFPGKQYLVIFLSEIWIFWSILGHLYHTADGSEIPNNHLGYIYI